MGSPRALASVALLAACASQPPGEIVQAVSGGTPSDRDAVVLVFTTPGETCSGTVIGPRHVLTAKLCVFTDTRPTPPSEIRVVVGPSVDAVTLTATASHVLVDETANVRVDPNQNDLALIVTTEELGVTPVDLATTPAAVDDVLTIAGFGQTESGASGERREGDLVVEMVMDDFYLSAVGLVVGCSGDAGGPALDATGDLVGVPLFIFSADAMSTPECGNAGAGIRDVVRYRDVILGWMTEADMDAGVDAGLDAAIADSGIPDGVVGDEIGIDAGSGGGGGCAAAGSGGGLSWFLLLAWRRRV